MKIKNKYLISPDINNNDLTKSIKGFDQNHNEIKTNVIKEKAITIYLNNQEIVLQLFDQLFVLGRQEERCN